MMIRATRSKSTDIQIYRYTDTQIYRYSRPNHTNTLIDSLEVLPPEVVWLGQDGSRWGRSVLDPNLKAQSASKC